MSNLKQLPNSLPLVNLTAHCSHVSASLTNLFKCAGSPLFNNECSLDAAVCGVWEELDHGCGVVGGIYLYAHEGMVDCFFCNIICIWQELHLGCGVCRPVNIYAIL